MAGSTCRLIEAPPETIRDQWATAVCVVVCGMLLRLDPELLGRGRPRVAPKRTPTPSCADVLCQARQALRLSSPALGLPKATVWPNPSL